MSKLNPSASRGVEKAKRKAINLINSIANIFRGRKIQKKYIMKPPAGLSAIFDWIDKGLQRQLAERDAEVIKLRHEIERIKEEKERDEYKEIAELASEYFKKRKEEERMRTLKLQIVGDDYPVWFLKDDYVYRNLFLKGFWLYQTPEGYSLWFPWLVNKKGKSFIPVKGAPSFDQLFRSNNPVTQIKGGKFDSNYVYDGFNLYLIPDKKIDTESGQPVNIINLSEQERREYEFKIEQLKEQYARLYNELQKMKEKEIGYLQEINDARLTAETQSKLADTYSGGLGVLAQKVATTGDALTKAMTTIQDAKLDQLLAENSVVHLKEAISELNEELATALKGVDSVLSRKVEERIKEMMEILERMSSSKPPK